MADVEGPKSLYGQIREAIENFKPVSIAGEFSQPSRIHAGNLPLFRVEELRAIALFPAHSIAIRDTEALETLTNQLRAKLPKEGFEEQKPFSRPYMWLGSLKYRERIGTTKRIITHQIEIDDPDFTSANPNFKLGTEHTEEHPVIRIIHIHPFPTQSIAELFVKYNQNRESYQYDISVQGLDYSLPETIIAEALAGRSLNQFLRPKVA